MHSRIKQVALASGLKSGSVAVLLSLATHASLGAVAIAHLRPAYRVDAHATRELAVDVPADDVSADDIPIPVQVDQVHKLPTDAPSAAQHRPSARSSAAPPQPEKSSASERLPSRPAAFATDRDESASPHFAMLAAAVTVNSTPSTNSTASRHPKEQTGALNRPFEENVVDAPAKLLTGTPPNYTTAAESAGIEAEVPLQVVIDAAGSVQSARALARIGYGLDEAAITAVRGYRFAPARRANTPVAVRMRWVVRFQLR